MARFGDVRTAWPLVDAPRFDAALVDALLAPFRTRIGVDWEGYRNHVLRVLHFCEALAVGDDALPESTLVAAAFHDIGIWTDDTLDYLEPSVAQATQYLCSCHRHDDVDPVQTIIREHHKLRTYDGEHAMQAEPFRRADLVDLSLGLCRFGLPRDYVARVRAAHPDHGFHWRLVRLTGRQLRRTPLNPLPMLRW